MMASAPAPRLNWRLISFAIVTAGVLLLIGANTHLVYVAFTSQSDCVPHARASGENGSKTAFRAAKSAC